MRGWLPEKAGGSRRQLRLNLSINTIESTVKLPHHHFFGERLTMPENDDVSDIRKYPCDKPADKDSTTPAFDFEQLSQGLPVILIMCEGQAYQLRKTKNGKLILHK